MKSENLLENPAVRFMREAPFAVLVILLAWASSAQAGMFNTVHFVEPGKIALGFEPEVTLTDGAGIAGNLKYTQGITDWVDGAVILGTGTGPERFRLGGDLVFDVFPDVDKQPGIGILARGIYYRQPNSGQFQLLGAPYIHKAFFTGSGDSGGSPKPLAGAPGLGDGKAVSATESGADAGSAGSFKEEIEPFVGVPLGMGFSSGTYQWLGQIVVGSMFRSSEKIRYSFEVGVKLNNSESYFSGGITYYP